MLGGGRAIWMSARHALDIINAHNNNEIYGRDFKTKQSQQYEQQTQILAGTCNKITINKSLYLSVRVLSSAVQQIWDNGLDNSSDDMNKTSE